MNKSNLISIFLLVFSLVYNAQSHAQTLEEKLKECSEISVSLIRLQCYDRITETTEVQSAKPARERTGLLSRLGRSSESKNDAKEENEAETEAVAKDDSSQASKSDDSFGLIIRDERDSMQSRILGEFKGWDGYTKFELENGQVWQQSSSGVLRVKISNPSITIKRSRVSDTYMLKVEGLNSSIRVKRVE